MRINPLRLFAQAALYGLFFAFIGYFASEPVYTHRDPGAAAITLSFGHAGETKEPCRRFTPEEIAAMPPNMRRPMDCPRERVPLLVELRVDDELVYHASLPPSGLAGDGVSSVFEQFSVSPGSHLLNVRLRDSRREEGFDYEAEKRVELSPGQQMVIDFRADTGGFEFL